MNIDMSSTGPTGPEEKLSVSVVATNSTKNSAMAALVDALAQAKLMSNSALTRRVEQYDATGGSQRGDVVPEDLEQDPSDESVDPLDDGLEQIAATAAATTATVQSPPSKKAKESEATTMLSSSAVGVASSPAARLASAAASFDVDLHSRAFAEALDKNDLLANFRSEFSIPKRPGSDQPGLYFVGNSLGLMPKAVRARVNEELDAWEERGVEVPHSLFLLFLCV